MVNTRIYVAGGPGSKAIRLRGRYYATFPRITPLGAYLPRQVLIDTHEPIGAAPNLRQCRFPFPENVMRQKRRQPYVHNCRVAVYDRNTRVVHRYMVFFKRHLHLRQNCVLMGMTSPALPSLRGDVVVMSLGSRYNYINMTTADIVIVDWMIERFAQEDIFSRRGVPRRKLYVRG